MGSLTSFARWGSHLDRWATVGRDHTPCHHCHAMPDASLPLLCLVDPASAFYYPPLNKR
jgi:hypothetical protein